MIGGGGMYGGEKARGARKHLKTARPALTPNYRLRCRAGTVTRQTSLYTTLRKIEKTNKKKKKSPRTTTKVALSEKISSNSSMGGEAGSVLPGGTIY